MQLLFIYIILNLFLCSYWNSCWILIQARHYLLNFSINSQHQFHFFLFNTSMVLANHLYEQYEMVVLLNKIARYLICFAFYYASFTIHETSHPQTHLLPTTVSSINHLWILVLVGYTKPYEIILTLADLPFISSL